MENPRETIDGHDRDGAQTHEATPLLGESHTAGELRHHSIPKWYWPWPAQYWAAIPVIFLAGLAIGPTVAMLNPLIKVLFCERGIPDWFKSKNNGSFDSLDENCDSAEYSAAIAKFSGLYSSLTAVLVTLTVRYWSSLSDRIGRKKTLLIWTIIANIGQIFPLLVYYNKNMSLYFLLVGGTIEGSVGSTLCLVALVHSYAADVSRPEKRTVVFGRIMAGYYAGLGFGSALGGMIARKFGLIAVFWMMPVIGIIDLIYVLLIPESLSVARLAENESSRVKKCQSQATLVNINNNDEEIVPEQVSDNNSTHSSLSTIKQEPEHLQMSWIRRLIEAVEPERLPNRLGGKHSIIILMFICFFALLSVMGAMYQSSTYLMYMFKWTGAELSYMGAIQGLSRLVSLTILLPIIRKLAPSGTKSNPVLGINFDIKIMIMGLWVEALTMLIYAVTPVGEGFYLGGVTGAVGSLFFPATRGILSQSVAPEKLGKTLGTLATFESLAAVIAPTMYAWLYALTLKVYPATVFYVAAVSIMLSSFLAITVAVIHRNEVKRRQHL
ncbi:hypothetical protein FBU30_001691 [Linnemannia zychae]|nr:hypothetical protein FBU30_001691 [Linnemannia zychae]